MEGTPDNVVIYIPNYNILFLSKSKPCVIIKLNLLKGQLISCWLIFTDIFFNTVFDRV